MAITTYGELQTALGNWLHRSDLTTYIPDFITLGEGRINAEVRVRAMETSFATAISSGAVALPSDYVELKHSYLSGTPVVWLERKSAEWIYANYPTRSAESKPSFVARETTNFIFGPYPDSNYTFNAVYYKRLSALSASVNSIFSSFPGLYLFSSLCEASPFLKGDARLQLWESKYQQIKSLVEAEDERENFSGSVLRVSFG